MKYVLIAALMLLAVCAALAYTFGNTEVCVAMGVVLMVVGLIMVQYLPTVKPMQYSGPDRRKKQVPTHHRRRATDIVGRDEWGGPGRYAR